MRKMDEMELEINQKGIKWSWFFMVISLFIWGGHNYAKAQKMPLHNYAKAQKMPLPLILVTLQFLVYFFVTSISKLKVDDGSCKKQVLISIGVLFLIIVFGAILYITAGR